MTDQRTLIIGTAGHIDHGKTVLVRALTGRDTDRLAEEKKRGISIDLGFAPLTLSDGSVVGIVDVPGHENFVRNMMAGATGVDLALLVVAADDGVMPQTREHLAILDLLGVERGVVAITKADLADDDLIPLVVDEVSELLEGTALEGSPIVPVSGVTGYGIDKLRSELEQSARAVKLKDEKLPARMPIDRVFTLKGIGTVVTGTLWSGILETGERLDLLPSGVSVRVRNLQVHDSDREAARAGERVAANLAGLARNQVSRGDVLVEPGYMESTYMIDVRLVLLKDSPRRLKRGTRVRFHHGTRELLGRVYPLDGEPIGPGEKKPAQLRLEARAVCGPGDRFVMRSYSPVTTIGGGTIVDAHPRKHKISDPTALADFKSLDERDVESRLYVYLSRAGEPLTAPGLVTLSGVPPEPAASGLSALVSAGRAAVLGDGENARYLSDRNYADAVDTIIDALQKHHEEKPLSEGMDKETVKKRTLSSWDSRLAEIFISDLAAEGVLESAGKTLRLPGASSSTTAEEKELIEEIVNRIAGNPVSPPTLSELSGELTRNRNTIAELIAIAEGQGRLIRISPDIYFSPEAVQELEKKLRQAASGEDGITVSDFRQLIGTSRKYAMPLLEYFDRQRVTVRLGDIRKLR